MKKFWLVSALLFTLLKPFDARAQVYTGPFPGCAYGYLLWPGRIIDCVSTEVGFGVGTLSGVSDILVYKMSMAIGSLT